MENLIKVNSNYNSLDKLHEFLKKESNYECSKTYDIWDMRTDANGQMEQCVVLKKSGMHAVKMYFTNEETVKVNHIIPSKVMNAYFGKSVKERQNVLEILTGVIKNAVLKGPQNAAFKELEEVVKKAS